MSSAKGRDLTPEADAADGDRLETELATRQGTTDHATLLARAAAFPRDLAATWAAATAEQRNDLAKSVIQGVEITDDRVTAVVPTADFAPFFSLAEGNETGQPQGTGPDRQLSILTGGSDGLCSHDCILPPGAIIVAAEPARRSAGRSRRAGYRTPRVRRLTPEQEAAIQRHHHRRTLRELAAEHGVSHETIRRVLRDRGEARAT